MPRLAGKPGKKCRQGGPSRRAKKRLAICLGLLHRGKNACERLTPFCPCFFYKEMYFKSECCKKIKKKTLKELIQTERDFSCSVPRASLDGGLVHRRES